jgi:2-(1,2-epoxy-1,2-dihydrophenyl)acetyl-CoA isomerase
MSETEAVRIEIKNRLAVVSLNRPDRLNAINLDLKQGLERALDVVQSDKNLRVVVIRGEGRAFCSGGDLNAIHKNKGMGRLEDLRYSQSILKKLMNLEQVTISAVHGFATGAGCNLALSTDLVYAAAGTRFSQAFNRVGLTPDWGGMYILPRLAGIRKAKELILFGKQFSAEDALSMGIINGIFSAETLTEEVMKLAHKLTQGPWMAIRLVKKIIDEVYPQGLDAIFDAEAESFSICKGTADFLEGLRAFDERRDPLFE